MSLHFGYKGYYADIYAQSHSMTHSTGDLARYDECVTIWAWSFNGSMYSSVNIYIDFDNSGTRFEVSDGFDVGLFDGYIGNFFGIATATLLGQDPNEYIGPYNNHQTHRDLYAFQSFFETPEDAEEELQDVAEGNIQVTLNDPPGQWDDESEEPGLGGDPPGATPPNSDDEAEVPGEIEGEGSEVDSEFSVESVEHEFPADEKYFGRDDISDLEEDFNENDYELGPGEEELGEFAEWVANGIKVIGAGGGERRTAAGNDHFDLKREFDLPDEQEKGQILYEFSKAKSRNCEGEDGWPEVIPINQPVTYDWMDDYNSSIIAA